jgi:hypothetical protein
MKFRPYILMALLVMLYTCRASLPSHADVKTHIRIDDCSALLGAFKSRLTRELRIHRRLKLSVDDMMSHVHDVDPQIGFCLESRLKEFRNANLDVIG